MTDNPLALEVQLVSIEPETQGPLRGGYTITLTFEHHGNTLTASFHTSSRQFRDDALLPVARDWFHRTCKQLAEATSDWAMGEDQLAAAKHPNSSR